MRPYLTDGKKIADSVEPRFFRMKGLQVLTFDLVYTHDGWKITVPSRLRRRMKDEVKVGVEVEEVEDFETDWFPMTFPILRHRTVESERS